ncbi:flavin reductase ActVB [Saccharothrix carnea]|uniref:Flavin reductase ActVB n=1 Tax=Saccharothrix carnea TaxID=1280637 RepID=A0A2P8I2J5_SACCR|nr:flavin reductase family protein [Saccharothrix carnea]PSL52690.1 flavin reductase ActVB [Saccharothrix carnea]
MTVDLDDPGALAAARFKDAMARFPSGVTITTTLDAEGRPHGFTASAFCSVSLDPPLVGVCLARSATCHPVFAERDGFAVNVLRPEQADIAERFARKDVDKFGDGAFRSTATGHVVLDEALVVLECTVHSRHEAGDHTILVGEVRWTRLGTGEPMVFFDRGFRRIAATAHPDRTDRPGSRAAGGGRRESEEEQW